MVREPNEVYYVNFLGIGPVHLCVFGIYNAEHQYLSRCTVRQVFLLELYWKHTGDHHCVTHSISLNPNTYFALHSLLITNDITHQRHLLLFNR